MQDSLCAKFMYLLVNAYVAVFYLKHLFNHLREHILTHKHLQEDT